ncbi:MAG: OprO/OprP family phosphate-selective porin [Pseudoalteromonas sp.]|uniref:Porin n=1 Tax=Pseudoalteromonas prydzensis TaxID=182141 RepID=A0ABR9FN63_9GAMM|nr:porin [Pseudoalteromonas prydzensis]MBE0458270.1 hypothetical protein [Pseudoalteromonas prydzensis]
MRTIPFFTTSLLLFGITAPVLANSNASQNEAIAEEINDLHNKIAALEKRSQSSWVDNLKVGALLQLDARYFPNSDSDSDIDSFEIRRARIDVRGNVSDSISFRILPEFGEVIRSRLLDAYVDWRVSEHNFFRIGKFKAPVGLERVQSVPRLTFLERGLSDNIVPNRDAGIAWNYTDKQFQTTLGVGNNVGDRQDTAVDNDNKKAIFARAYWQPEALNGLGIGVAGSIGNTEQNASLPTYKSLGRATIFRYNSDVLRDGKESRIAPHFTWYRGSFGSYGEYIISKTSLTNNQSQQSELSNKAWQWVGSWIITGERNSWSGIKPDSSKGAWELAFRLSSLDIDDKAFTHHADLTRSVSKASSATIGLNWHINNKTKVLINYEQTRFEGGAVNDNRDNEQLLSARLQINY